ncbi:MAG: hypothetical protein ABSD03_03215 [Vulcanimicrobiaceae bacterium]
MSGRDADVDALFERDADARLLDRRRREELGLAATSPPPSAAAPRFGAESLAAEPPVRRAARPATLRLALEARPDRELIPGALVTVVATLHDDGDQDVPDATLRIGVPPDAEPVPGSFARDESTIDGEALLGAGLRLGAIPAGGAVRLRFALRILPGTEPLDLIGAANADGVPAIATPALRLRRRAGHAAYDTPKPFFELEADERVDLDELAAAPRPAHVDARSAVEAAPEAPADLPRPEPEQILELPEPAAVLELPAPPPIPALPEPAAVLELPEPEPVLELPEPPPVPELPGAASEPAPVAAADPVLFRAVDPEEVRALERIYTGALPHGLAALALLSSIAAVDGPAGEALGLSAFARSIATALPRAVVAARMGRPTPPVVTAVALAALRPAADLAPDPGGRAGPYLVVELGTQAREALLAVLGRNLADPFLRGVQVLLAVAPRRLTGIAAPAPRFEDALAAYRSAAGSWLMRVTVRRTVDGRFDPLTADDAPLHAAGRAVVDALRAAITP